MREANPERPEVQRVLADARARPRTTLGELAQHAHLSEFHLSRLVRQHLGFPLRDFLSALKIERGVDALVDGHDVTHSQTEAGHDSPSSYNRAFTRHTGLAPSTYRQQMGRLAAHLMKHMGQGKPIAVLHRTFDAATAPQPHPLTINVTGGAPEGALFLALHPSPIIHGEPLLGVALLGAATYYVRSIPDGTYYAMVVEVPKSTSLRSYFHMSHNRRQLRREPIQFPLAAPTSISLELRELHPDDPPITINLPKLFFNGQLDVVDVGAK